MPKFKKILFLSQGTSDTRASLEQSIRLAWSNKASLTALLVCPRLPDDMRNYEVQYEQWLLEALQNNIDDCLGEHNMTEEDMVFPIKLLAAEKPAITAIQYVLDEAIDLVVKDAEGYQSKTRGLRAVDMSLLRKCPCPVWLNRPSEKPRNKQRVAVAINPNATSDEERLLSIRLLQLARNIADSCDSRLHVLSCWEYSLEHYLEDHVWIHVSEQELKQQIESAKDQHVEALQSLIHDSTIAGDIVLHHLHGTADDEIPNCVEDSKIDVLVMGTLARTGIPGVVIGNTAENILQSVRCSLVALKPDNFQSPLAS